MMVKCTLSCQNPSQRAEFNLSDCLMDMSSVDFSKCAAVFEDGSYEIYFVCEQYNRTEVKSVAVCVNGEQVGDIILSANTAIVEGSIDGGCFALFFAVFRSIYLSCVAVFLHSLHRFQVA